MQEILSKIKSISTEKAVRTGAIVLGSVVAIVIVAALSKKNSEIEEADENYEVGEAQPE